MLTDLNTLIPGNSGLQLIGALGINARGQIVAFAFEFSTGDVHAVLLNPHSTSTNQANASATPAEIDYDGTTKLIAALKEHPEGFHGVGGLLLLSALDDASRNAALCSGTAYQDSMDAVVTNSDIHSAQDWINTALSCIDVSCYLYTVGESVQALLVRDMEARQVLNQHAEDTLKRCSVALKECASHRH